MTDIRGNFSYLVSSYFFNNIFDPVMFLVFYLGTQMAQSRYLFALSCFRMDLLAEAEKALLPMHDSNLEVILAIILKSMFSLCIFPDRMKMLSFHSNFL